MHLLPADRLAAARADHLPDRSVGVPAAPEQGLGQRPAGRRCAARCRSTELRAHRSRLLAGRVRGLRVPAVLDRATRARDRRRRSRPSRRTSPKTRAASLARTRAPVGDAGRAGHRRRDARGPRRRARATRGRARPDRRRVRGERRDRRRTRTTRSRPGCSAATRRAHSKPPGASQTFPCPNCGAPWQAAATGTQVCATCNQVVDNGRFDWVVDQISVDSIDERPPTLTTETQERGTDLADLQGRRSRRRMGRARRRRSRGHRGDARAAPRDDLRPPQQGVVEQRSRAGARLRLRRPLRLPRSTGSTRTSARACATSSPTCGSRRSSTRRSCATSSTTRSRSGSGAPARTSSCKSETGQVVRGSKHRERAYSEYWTLIRSAGKKGAPKAEPTCGNCGAPLDVTHPASASTAARTSPPASSTGCSRRSSRTTRIAVRSKCGAVR